MVRGIDFDEKQELVFVNVVFRAKATAYHFSYLLQGDLTIH